MDHRILVSGKADVPDLAGLLGCEYGLEGPLRREEAVRILHPDVLVELNQINVIGFEPPERLIDLVSRRAPGAPIELRHQEHLVAIPVAERIPHPALALAIVIIPAVVHEGDPAVDGRPNDP